MPKPFKLGEHRIKWHGTLVHRLRLCSYAAEKLWHMAFALRLGLNRVSPDIVRTVWLDDVEVDGVKKRGEVEVELPGDYQELAFKIACATVELLEHEGYRILNAVVPEHGAGGAEHDIVAERKGLLGPSSWEVKCKTIKHPDKLLAIVQQQLRKDALALWRPASYSERGVVLFEFADGASDRTWRTIRCEVFDGTWRPIIDWGESNVPPTTATSSGTKRKVNAGSSGSKAMGSSKKSTRVSNSSQANFVLIGGEKFTTLAWYLDRPAVKSEQQAAAA